MSSDFDYDDHPPPRRTHHTHRMQGSFGTGFGGCFGGCLGMAAAGVVLVIGLIVGGIYLSRGCERVRENAASRTTQQQADPPPKTAPAKKPI